MLPRGTLPEIALVLSSSDDFDIQMSQSLALLGNRLGVSRAYVFIAGDAGELLNTHEWCAPGIAPLINARPLLHRDDLPSLAGLLAVDAVIAVADVATLPADLRRQQEAEGARAVLAASLQGPDGAFGLIGFDDCVKTRQWEHADQENLRTIAGLVSTAWQRHLLGLRLKASEAALRAAHDRLANILEGARLGTWEWDVPGGQLIINARWAGILGHALADLAPLSIDTWRRLVHLEDLAGAEAALEAHFAGASEFYEHEFRMRHRDGHWVWVHSRGQVFERDGEGRPLRMYGVHTDISSRKLLEEKIRELAVRDALTGLYNRRYLMERLTDILAEYQRYGRTFAVAMFDIDHFKRVNDVHGHHAGDVVLRAFAQTIAAGVRQYDLFARYGGEEFVLVSPSATAADLAPVIERLLGAVRALAVPVAGGEVRFTVSCGLGDSSELTRAAPTVESLIDLVDKRLYQAKQGGRDRCVGPAAG